MRYTVTKTAKPAKKPFNMAEAMEALNTQLESLHISYDEVVAAEGRVVEAEQFLTDCHTALESIKTYGITVENMSVLNTDNGLDQALGLEKLACEAIESLSESSKKLLQSQYVAGLEDLTEDNKKGFIQKVKDFIAKVWNWLKEFFVSDAKVIAMLKECKFEGEISADKQIVGLKYADAKAAYDNLVSLKAHLVDDYKADNTPETYDNATESGKPAIRERGTCADLGWDAAKAKDYHQKLMNDIPSRQRIKESIDALIQHTRSELAREVGETAAGADSAFKRGVAHVAGWSADKLLYLNALKQRWQLLSLYDKNYRTLAFTLIAINNAMQAAPAAQ